MITVFQFIETLTLRKEFALGKSLETKLRQTLPEGIYWIQPNGKKILWNHELIRDYLLRSGLPQDRLNNPVHKKLVEKYLDWANKGPKTHETLPIRGRKGF